MGESVVKAHLAVTLCVCLQCGGGVTVRTMMLARRLRRSELRFVIVALHSAMRACLVSSSHGPTEVWVLEVSCLSTSRIPLSSRELLMISMRNACASSCSPAPSKWRLCLGCLVPMNLISARRASVGAWDSQMWRMCASVPCGRESASLRMAWCRGKVLWSACRVEFMKQVLPKLCRRRGPVERRTAAWPEPPRRGACWGLRAVSKRGSEQRKRILKEVLIFVVAHAVWRRGGASWVPWQGL